MKNKKIVPAALGMVMMSGMAMAAAPAAQPSSVDSFINGLDTNIGVTTNYVFRGISQGEGLPAVQGGATWNHASGLSVDLWLSSSADTAGGLSDEYDVTVSYSMKQGNMGYEFGLASYNYPQAGSVAAGHEIFAGLNVNSINAYLYLSPTQASGNNLYIELSTDIDRINLALGINSNDNSLASYNQFTATVNLTNDLSYSISQTDIDGAKAEMALTYSIPLK